jgi:hypothetical protein
MPGLAYNSIDLGLPSQSLNRSGWSMREAKDGQNPAFDFPR